MTNNDKICGLLGLATKAGKIVFGTEACKSEISKNKVKLVLIALDVSEKTKLNIRKLCCNKEVPVWEGLTIEKLSKAIGKDNKAIIGIKDENFSHAILELIDGGETIG